MIKYLILVPFVEKDELAKNCGESRLFLSVRFLCLREQILLGSTFSDSLFDTLNIYLDFLLRNIVDNAIFILIKNIFERNTHKHTRKNI